MSDAPDSGSAPPGTPYHKPSGAQRAREAKQAMQGDESARLAPLDPTSAALIEQLGDAPEDPAQLSLWFQRLAGKIARIALTGEIGPGQHARLRLALEAADKAGRNAVKALDKERQLKVAKRLGLVEKASDGLDAYPKRSAKLGDT